MTYLFHFALFNSIMFHSFYNTQTYFKSLKKEKVFSKYKIPLSIRY